MIGSDIITKHKKIIDGVSNYLFYKYLNNLDILDKDDLNQEGCLVYLNVMKEYDPNEHDVNKFIFRRVTQGLIDYIRSKTKRKRSDCIKIFNYSDIESKNDYIESDDDTRFNLFPFLSGLDKKDRKYFELYLDGYKKKEIADICGTRRDVVGHSVNSTLEKLNKIKKEDIL